LQIEICTEGLQKDHDIVIILLGQLSHEILAQKKSDLWTQGDQVERIFAYLATW
jgi:hypothetical protein